MPTLPVSRVRVTWRPFTGETDLLLHEQASGLAGAVAVAAACAARPDGIPLDLDALPIGDLDALIVELRRSLLGELVVGEGSCDACGAVVDLRFELGSYLAHHAPGSSRTAIESEEPGWWHLTRSSVRFRLPTVRDLREVAGGRAARASLVARCLRGDPAGTDVRRAERAMAVLGPMLRGPVAGRCPECATAVDLDFDAREFCLRELHDHSGVVLADVDLLARTYHWSEREILDLPSPRRSAYVDLVLSGATPVSGSSEVLVA